MKIFISKYKIFILCLTLTGLSLLTSCRYEEEIFAGKYLSVLNLDMKIEENGNPGTRFDRTGIDDEWSIVDFTENDEMGFYASGGNWLGENNMFVNQELVYKGESRFTTPDGEGKFSPSDMNGNEVYMYFPYCAEMGTTGLELRTKVSDGSIRCIDYLSANTLTMDGKLDNEDTAMFGTFTHTFSEIIIMRGEGFDSPPPNTADIDYSRITAVIDNGYTHIKVNLDTEEGWSCEPQLYYNQGNSLNLSPENAQRWNAWKGENYGKTVDNPEGTEAWYVIVPTIGTSGPGRTTVDYIELYDNEGNLQRVSSLKLSGANTSNPTKFLDSGWRYPMEITMQELVPTVNPFPISRWNENIDLSDTREYGINDIYEFATWVYDYNAYLSEPSDENSEKLMSYGDKIITKDSEGKEVVTWNFYILSNLNMNEYKPIMDDDNLQDVSPYIIPELTNASLNGQSSTLTGGEFLNYQITGLNQTFIGVMTNGQIQNIDFIAPDIRDEVSSQPMGILVSEMVNSNVLNCNITGGTLFNPNGPGGFVAGAASGGSVKNCTLEGSLISSSTATGDAEKIIGNPPVGTEFEKNDVSDVVLTN